MRFQTRVVNQYLHKHFLLDVSSQMHACVVYFQHSFFLLGLL